MQRKSGCDAGGGRRACEMKSWFSAAFMSSPKWIDRRLSACAYFMNAFSPPGKELWSPLLDVPCTSHGSSRDVMLITVSALESGSESCSSHIGKANIERYLAPTPPLPFEKDRRSAMCFFALFAVKVSPDFANQSVLLPAT